jgi:hypothetical protein
MASEYQLVAPIPGIETQTVLRVRDQAFIPFDGGNRDYRLYSDFLAGGGVPDPAPDPTVLTTDV